MIEQVKYQVQWYKDSGVWIPLDVVWHEFSIAKYYATEEAKTDRGLDYRVVKVTEEIVEEIDLGDGW